MKTLIGIGIVSTMAVAAPGFAQTASTNSSPDDIIVTGDRPQDSVQAGKTDVPLIETPQAISVVSEDDIRARGVTRLSEALRTVAGVSRSTTYGFYDAYTIRGFDAAYGSVYLDGLVNEAGVGLNQELSAIEQIEVLKGPSSMLFGQAPLGGLINLVSKRPQADPFLRVTASTGSWNLIESTVDANAPLNSSKTLLARINLTYRDADSFVRNAGINRVFVAPAISWQPTRNTTLTLLGRYQRDRDNPLSPVPAYGTVLPGVVPIPQDFAINNAGDQRVVNNRDRWQIGYIFDQRFSDALSFSQTLRYTHRKEYWNRWMFAAGFLDATGQPSYDSGGNEAPTDTIGRYFYGPYRAIDKDFAVDSRLKGKFTLAGVTNEWIAGVDYRHNSESYYSGGDYDPTHFPLNIANPNYNEVFDTTFVTGASGSSKAHQTGIYIQDHLKFGDVATLTFGGRYDWSNSTGQKDKAFSPRIGATVKLVPGVNLYASWSRSFLPQLYTLQVVGFDDQGNPIGGPVVPERGRNIEAGIKFAPNARLSGSIAIYKLTRQNVATADPIYPDFSVITGEQQSRGIEAEMRWQPVAGFSLSAAYTYVDAKVTKDNFFTVGAPLSNIPGHNVGIFAQYEVPKGPLAGLGATLAFTYNSKRNGDVYSTRPGGEVLLWLPAYTLVDAGLSYKRSGWGAQLTVVNVFDKRYWPDTGGIDRVSPGNPRNFRLTLSRDF